MAVSIPIEDAARALHSMIWGVGEFLLSRFIIHGGRPLEGEIRASGSKNAVLPMIAAALLTDEEVVLENVPSIRDVDVMLEIAGVLGAEVSRVGDRVAIRAADLDQQELPFELCERVRTSILFVAPLVHRLGRAKLHPPGGDGIGRRRLDTHFYGLRGLGVEIDEAEFEFRAGDGLEGSMLFFDEASVTATEHIMMAAALAKGTTTILNAASEPHVMDLAAMLVSMGAKIEGLFTNTLTITGVEKLSGAHHRVVSDHIEVGSYLALAAATGGGITIHDTVRGHYWMMHRVFERFGIEIDVKSDRIVMPSGQTPRIRPDAGGAIPQVDDGPWPQFPTDMMSPFLVLATQSEGTILFFEKMFEGRMYFVDPLIQMGANAIICDPHRVIISGRSQLRGQTVRSPDIRAGMAMIIAALCATRRPCVVQNAEIVDRGYERVEEKLRALGADVVREED
jgi:UDP-N-acetylglucosamine 1-carboxyvinyltransferase